VAGVPTEQPVVAQTLQIRWRPRAERPTSLEGSAGGSLGAAREVIGEVGGVVAVRGASGPWGRPLGPMEMRVIRRITGAPMGPMTTKMRRSSSSSPPPLMAQW
jgi:hypothetical protein